MKNDNPFLSIIIPCYNVPIKQLRRCLESLLFVGDYVTYDVWIVDDGSDRDEVCDWVQSLRRDNIHALRQENAGPGGARNTGIDHCRGEYIQFVDADDFVLFGPHTQMLNILRQQQPDILVQDCPSCYEGSATDYMFSNDVNPSCYNYFIRRSVLGDLRFSPHLFHENEEFCTRLHLLDARLMTLNYSAYSFQHRPESITYCRKRTHLRKRYADHVQVMRNLQALQVPSDRTAALQRQMRSMVLRYVINLLNEAPDFAFLLRHLQSLRSTGLYPLSLEWHGMKYTLVALLCCYEWSTIVMMPLVKLILKMYYGETHKRAFATNAYLANAEDPAILGPAVG